MLAKKLVLLGAVAGLTLAGVRPGVAAGQFDSVTHHSSTSTDKATATVAAASTAADDGSFELSASASQADTSLDGQPAHAFAVAAASKSFDLEPGKWEAEVFIRELFGNATREGLGDSGSSFHLRLECSACTWTPQDSLRIVTAVPTQDSIEYGEVTDTQRFTVTAQTIVKLTVTVTASATTGNGVVVSGQNPVYAHGGGGSTTLKGIVDSITMKDLDPPKPA